MFGRLRVGFAVLTTAAALFGLIQSAVQSQSSDPAQFVGGQVLTKFSPGATEAAKAEARSLVGATRQTRLWTDGSGELELIHFPFDLAVPTAISRLQQHPSVIFAEPNWIQRHEVEADDPYYTDGSLWGTYGDTTSPANPFGSQPGSAWAAGTPVIVTCMSV